MKSNGNFLYKIALAAVWLVAQSCEKPVKFDLGDSEKGLVLNAILKQDSTVLARLSFVQAIHETEVAAPSTAVVQLFENGTWKEDLQAVTINSITYYKGVTKTISGNEYRLIAKVDGYSLLEGADIIPENPVTESEQIKLTATTQDGDKLSISFILTDPPEQKNYYRLQVFGPRDRNDGSGTIDTIPKPVHYTFKNPEFGGRYLDGYPEEYSEYYFDDALFNGQRKKIGVDFFPLAAVDTNTYQLVVTQLSEPAYRYFKTKQASTDNNGDPFTEPSIIFSNIKNGYGIVAGLAYKKVNLKQ